MRLGSNGGRVRREEDTSTFVSPNSRWVVGRFKLLFLILCPEKLSHLPPNQLSVCVTYKSFGCMDFKQPARIRLAFSMNLLSSSSFKGKYRICYFPLCDG